MATYSDKTPEDLAREFGVEGITVRAFLRATYPARKPGRGGRWRLTTDMVDATRAFLLRRTKRSPAPAPVSSAMEAKVNDREISFQDADALAAAGFQGFQAVANLRLSCDGVPEQPGVYIVLRQGSQPPRFLERNPGHWFKGKDPTLPTADLLDRWTPDAAVVYIGKAGTSGESPSSSTLRSRIKDFIRFGVGKPAAHWGGRLTWQLDGAAELIVCWKPMGDARVQPAAYEASLIGEFRARYGRYPFANMRA